MDAYLPLPVTTTVRMPVSGNDMPWEIASGTQTIIWQSAHVTRRSVQNSSFFEEQPPTFFIVNVPEIQGLHRLRTIRGWRENWDGEGGKAPDPATVDTASVVFGILSVHRPPQIALSAEGHPMFLYGAPLNGEVVVTSPGTIDYFFADDGAPEGEDVKFDGFNLPQDLLDHISVA